MNLALKEKVKELSNRKAGEDEDTQVSTPVEKPAPKKEESDLRKRLAAMKPGGEESEVKNTGNMIKTVERKSVRPGAQR
jgi:hypothetical protein